MGPRPGWFLGTGTAALTVLAGAFIYGDPCGAVAPPMPPYPTLGQAKPDPRWGLSSRSTRAQGQASGSASDWPGRGGIESEASRAPT